MEKLGASLTKYRICDSLKHKIKKSHIKKMRNIDFILIYLSMLLFSYTEYLFQHRKHMK